MKLFHTSFKVLWIGLLILAILSFSIDLSASPKPYKGKAKMERKFAERKARNQAEQYRIQSSGIKKYKRSNLWQIGRH